MSLTPSDFPQFFYELYGYKPFPWQTRLMQQVAENGWPELLDLPTGSGKTAVIEIAVFHLALHLGNAPRRIFFVVDRRIIVDAAFRRAKMMIEKLEDPSEPTLRKVREALQAYGGTHPLAAAILRGGMYRDSGWAASPVQPVICVSTVDQVGSRLLFRGYGLSPSMQPIHAGLVGQDSLLFLDEAHLSLPFSKTLASIQGLRSQSEQANLASIPPLKVVTMTATPDAHESQQVFRLDEEDRQNEKLRQRVQASKLALLDEVKTKTIAKTASREERSETEQANRRAFVKAVIEHARRFAGLEIADKKPKSKKSKGKPTLPEFPPAKVIGIVVNRVATARQVCERLRELKNDAILLTGRIRPLDRDALLFGKPGAGSGYLPRIQAGRDRKDPTDGKPLFVVATQTIEAGADLDFDALITEAASLDALRQRFGRLDRLGDLRQSPAVILARSDSVKNEQDPVYGSALPATWKRLQEWAGKEGVVDFGVESLGERVAALGDQLAKLLPPQPPCPDFLATDLNTLCQTNPPPEPRPEVAFWLHGAKAQAADVQIVWRADLPLGEAEEQVFLTKNQEALLSAVSRILPSSPETLAVPIYEAQRWLLGDTQPSQLSDVEGAEAEESSVEGRSRQVLRWCGPDDERTELIRAEEIRPGDTILVPSQWGGCDQFGWNPASSELVEDLAERANLRARHRPCLRLSDELLKHWQHFAAEPTDLNLPLEVQAALTRVPEDQTLLPFTEATLAAFAAWETPPESLEWMKALANAWPEKDVSPEAIFDATGEQVGWFVSARKRWTAEAVQKVLLGDASELEDELTTEEDAAVAIGNAVWLSTHSREVAERAVRLAEQLKLPESLQELLRLAGEFHDLGKLDYRFQIWMHSGLEHKAIEAEEPLAKSKMLRLADSNQARARSGWPKGYRHEAISVRLVEALLKEHPAKLPEEIDRELLLFLIGTHHGHGRPFFPPRPDKQPEQITWDYKGSAVSVSSDHRLHQLSSDWPDLFWRLHARFDPWMLALLEAVFRLADHAVSAEESQETPSPSEAEVTYA